MAFRFRKSINLGGGARLNLSKSGIGASVGGKGFRVTKKAGGGTRTTASIPGTGISYVKDSKTESGTKSAVSAVPASPNFLLFWIVFRVLSIIMIPAGLLLAIVEPVFGLAAAAFGIVLWKVATRNKIKHLER